jgi:glycosyltransferase involved in cell wall biosynthesis
VNGKHPLRIGMVHYSPFEIDSRVQRQASALAHAGHQIDSICLTDNPGPWKDGSIRLHSVGQRKQRDSVLSYLSGYVNFFAAALRKLSALDRERRFDVVEVHNMPNILTLTSVRPKLRGAAVLLDVHDTFPELFATKFDIGPRHPLLSAVKLEERVSAMFVDHVMAVTEEAKGRLNSRGVGRGRTTVVMNSPDESVFGPQRDPKPIPADGEIKVVYHGGVDHRFGVTTLVEAAAIAVRDIPGLKVRIYGAEADANARLIKLASRVAPGIVEVAPQPTPFAQIPELIADCDIGVVPTIHDPFTELLLPVKLLECIHTGLAVAASRLPLLEDYFGADALNFFEPGSPSSLAATLVEMCQNRDESLARARTAAVRLEDVAWPAQSARYVELVEALARRKGARVAA